MHGGIDGYSRRNLWLEAADNKRARTLVRYFDKSASHLGAPLRVRCDKGKENKHIMLKMHLLRDGTIHKPVLAGRSIHNTRIERLWGKYTELLVRSIKRYF